MRFEKYFTLVVASETVFVNYWRSATGTNLIPHSPKTDLFFQEMQKRDYLVTTEPRAISYFYT